MISAHKTAHIYSLYRNSCAHESQRSPKNCIKKKKRMNERTNEKKIVFVQRAIRRNRRTRDETRVYYTYQCIRRRNKKSHIYSVFGSTPMGGIFGGELLPLLCLTLPLPLLRPTPRSPHFRLPSPVRHCRARISTNMYYNNGKSDCHPSNGTNPQRIEKENRPEILARYELILRKCFVNLLSIRFYTLSVE